MSQVSLVVDKVTGQVVFASFTKVLSATESLWPPAAFSYFDLHAPEVDVVAMRSSPWLFRVEGGTTLVPFLIDESQREVCVLNSVKAKALTDLTRAVNRHRRQILKFDLYGQDLAYAMKSEEAARFLTDSSNGVFPMLTMEAAITGSTLEQVAAMIRFRTAQSQEYLVESERQRRSLTTRVIQATNKDQLEVVHSEIMSYARRY